MIPGFVDSHTHLVFAGDRAPEFAARMAGTPYAAGGIRTTVAATRAATDEQLTSHVARLVAEMRRQGTTTVEIKSGYGLTVHDEARGLAVARQFTEETTFLGAHVVPPSGDPAAYVDLVTGPMLDAARAARPLDRRLLRARRLRRRPGPRDPRGRRRGRAARPAARQPARPRPRRAARRRARAGRRRPLHLPRGRRRRRARRLAAPSRPCCRASSSRPGSPTPMPGGCSTPASRVAIATRLQPRARASPARCRSASRSRSARWG